jgi:hypothetical protein
VGNYTGTITLTDKNKYPMSTKYKIDIEILPDPSYVAPEKPKPKF